MPLTIPNAFAGTTSGTTKQLDDDFSAIATYINGRAPSPRTLAAGQFQQTTADTFEKTALNYPMPANTMAVATDVLVIDFHFSTAPNGNTKRFTVYLGATVVFDTGLLVMNGQSGHVRTRIAYSGASAQSIVSEATWISTGSISTPTQFNQETTGAEVFANPLTVRVAMTNGSPVAGDCRVNLTQVVFYPATA